MCSADNQNLPRPLTGADKVEAFKTATRNLPKRFEQEIQNGLTDEALKEMLCSVMGIYAGTCGAGRMSVCWQSSGLKIWAAWHVVNTVREKPIFAGKATLAAARNVYGIKEPGDTQMGLF